jgi:hypothetical protein
MCEEKGVVSHEHAVIEAWSRKTMKKICGTNEEVCDIAQRGNHKLRVIWQATPTKSSRKGLDGNFTKRIP